jgi:hypothetical protein
MQPRADLKKGNKEMNLTKEDYKFLRTCTDIEFNNWCIRWLSNDSEHLNMGD